MNPEWIVVGAILLGAMTVGGVNLSLKRRKELRLSELDNNTKMGFTDSEKDEK